MRFSQKMSKIPKIEDLGFGNGDLDVTKVYTCLLLWEQVSVDPVSHWPSLLLSFLLSLPF